MRYIDSGSRDPNQTLGAWLQAMLTSSVVGLRMQSGFFSAEALGFLAPTLVRLAASNQLVNVLIGSNESATLRSDVFQLGHLIGLPRSNVRFGVVQYVNGFFHPKVYHFLRADGSQFAYVGSANYSAQGVTSLHIEAGMLLDTDEGDDAGALNAIAAAVDDWFASRRDGLNVITDLADIDRLVDDDVLAFAPPPCPPAPPKPLPLKSGATGASRPRLRGLIALPPLPMPRILPALAPATAAHVSIRPLAPLPSVNKQGVPEHVLFDPQATGPTTGITALSGGSLPGEAIGLVIRLSRDDTRIFAGEGGTANINLPVETMQTLRFGVFGRGDYPARPRAEFDLVVRYIGNSQTIALPDPIDTNIMLYGYLPGESGHQNRRMLLPADARLLGTRIQHAGLPLPTVGHFALMEWPTSSDPEFGLSFLEPGSPLAQKAQELFTSASSVGQLTGRGACWLLPNISPPW